MLRSGERQVAPTLDGIRADHRHRYEWAASVLKPGSFVLDYGCGIGYGARILAEAGHRVVAVDDDAETIAFARANYAHPNIRFVCEKTLTAEVCRWPDDEPIHQVRFDAAVAFEVIEHVPDPAPLLRAIRANANRLLASVPNEAVFPFRCEANDFKGWAFHHRHYTSAEFVDLLIEAGWHTNLLFSQEGPRSPVKPGSSGRTVIAACEPGLIDSGCIVPPEASAAYRDVPAGNSEKEPEPGPGHVVILGLGPSLEQYLDLVKRLGSRHAFADQVWAINALGDIVQCDLVFHLDDVRVQMLRAEAAPRSNIARMVDWLKTHPGPIMTSRAHPDFPGLVEFPLEDVINSLGYAYFNGTAAYAAAYAIYRGATKISFFGCDYTMANSHAAEKGRACLEFWIGYAAARGIELGFADRTSLMDTCDDAPDGELNVYGFDFDHVRVERVDGLAKITFEPKETPPTAAEMEARYDHSKPLVRL